MTGKGRFWLIIEGQHDGYKNDTLSTPKKREAFYYGVIWRSQNYFASKILPPPKYTGVPYCSSDVIFTSKRFLWLWIRSRVNWTNFEYTLDLYTRVPSMCIYSMEHPLSHGYNHRMLPHFSHDRGARKDRCVPLFISMIFHSFQDTWPSISVPRATCTSVNLLQIVQAVSWRRRCLRKSQWRMCTQSHPCRRRL